MPFQHAGRNRRGTKSTRFPVKLREVIGKPVAHAAGTGAFVVLCPGGPLLDKLRY